MSSFREPPQYREPKTIISPEVDNISKQRAFIQSGINYRCYQQVPLTDQNEIYSNSRALNYYFHQKICYINPKKTYLAIKVECLKDGGQGLANTDFVTCAPMKGHGLIDDISTTIGKHFFGLLTF